jgi:hypothetical protein
MANVQQVRIAHGVKIVECLEHDTLDRYFRVVWRDVDIQEGDQLWWVGYHGYLTRKGEFEDKKIGRCEPAGPGFNVNTDSEFFSQYEGRFSPKGDTCSSA